MEDFLTTRQTQDILKVDRITIYRMVNDGRLKGNKIGQQWRFPRADVEGLLNGSKSVEDSNDGSLPVHCLQTIQDLFATVSQYSAVLINPQGSLITKISNPCSLCQLIQNNPSNTEACQASRVDFIRQARNNVKRFTCHAGLQYVGMPVTSGNDPIGLFLVGGYRYAQTENRDLEGMIKHISTASKIPPQQAKTLFETLPVLPDGQEKKLEIWATATAQAFESILQERSTFARRLKKIADLTQLS
jgi:excisionase family DNA binding protein